MDTLQDAYKDTEEDDSNGEEIPILNSTNPNSISNNHDTGTPIPSITTVIEPESEPEPKPEPMVVESVQNPSTTTEPEPEPELEPEPMPVEWGENPTTVSEPEPMPVESKEKPTTVTEPKPEQMPVELGENPTTVTETEPKLMPVESGENPITTGPKPEPMPVELSEGGTQLAGKVEPLGSDEVSTDSISEDEQNPENSDKKHADDDESEEQGAAKRQKSLSQIDNTSEVGTPVATNIVGTTPSSGSKKGSKSSKKKSKGNNVWTKPTRKAKKKAKNTNSQAANPKPEDTVLIAPVPRFPDKNDDSPDAKICLSKVHKAEKVELSEDRLSAGSCKGYRMVRATRGVVEGAWYFEIKVVCLGGTGHTRLGWSTEKGDLQAPVGYDGNSFGYRDIDGSKIHKALREKYGEEGYKEGDVIGFYINLPEGNLYAPKAPQMVLYKGQKYVCASDPKEDPPKIVPGSEISFFKNGICQGVAFKDLYGGHYYPAASMYTLPNQPNCLVKFNFGPDFDCFPTDFEGRPVPRPMIELPYHGFDNRLENGVLDEKKQ